jgi:spore maturation protein CgeB
VPGVTPDVRTLQNIKQDIERATERRAELYHALSQGHDVVLAAELKELEEEIARLWTEHREARVRQRFGDRDRIIKRARLEERLERAA